ncbi:MAG: hypothetical protein CME70_21660 [Halobacteriovorax sp.]|nr:hypothetical protein [Halobacteriovorax sp.]|tara:strand:- start:1691 stop:2068 length:378 start_codon:yes stop_codon:yes gene_type:complete
MFKAILLSFCLLSISIYAQDETSVRVGIDTGGGGASRVLTGIDTGGGGRIAGGIELLKLERINNSNEVRLRNARPEIRSILNTNTRPETIVKMMKLKILADLKDIAEITLRDGTVLKTEEILKSE